MKYGGEVQLLGQIEILIEYIQKENDQEEKHSSGSSRRTPSKQIKNGIRNDRKPYQGIIGANE